MCIFRITTYDECWGQYTHLLICSNESSNNDELTSPQDRVLSALKCPNLKSEHINVGGSRCNCKINPQDFNTVCNRMWGGDFVGSVNCSMNPGFAVKFQFRGREWENCTNVETLLRGGDRNVPDDYNSSAQAWNDSEWDGDNKQVDWRDKDWVTLAEKGMVTWQSRRNRKASKVQDPMTTRRIQFPEESQTYEEVRLEKNEMFSTEHNLTRPKRQKLPPRYNGTNHHVGSIDAAVFEWRRLKDQKEAAVDGRQNLPSRPPSVGQPQHQKDTSIPHISHSEHGRHLAVSTDHQNQQSVLPSFTATVRTQPIIPTGPKAMPIRKAERARRERKKSQGVQSGGQSTADIKMRSTIPLGPKVLPVWQLAQILKEKQEQEKKNLETPPGTHQQSLIDLSATAATREDDFHDQVASEVRLEVPNSLETSPAHVAASESLQDERERGHDQKRNKLLQDMYEQRVVLREKQSEGQVHESGPSVQNNLQHLNTHIPSREDNDPSTTETIEALGKPWNGVSEYVVSQKYNDTLPESDDRNFHFNSHTSFKQPGGEVQMADINEASNSTPGDLYDASPHQTSSTLVENLQAASYIASDPPRRRDLTPLELCPVERSQAKCANHDSHLDSNLSESKLDAERRAEQHQEIAEQSRLQALEREQKTQDDIQTRRQSDILMQEPSHLRENFQRKAFRKLQEIEEQSKIPGNKNKRDFLHDSSQLDTFLQDFAIPQQDTAREMWMAEKAEVDGEFSKFYGTIAIPSKEVTDSLQVSKHVVSQACQDKVDEKNDVEDKSVEDRSLPQNRTSPANTSRLPPKSELPYLLKEKRKSVLMAKMIHDQEMKERFMQDVPFPQQKMARYSWIQVEKFVDHRLQKLLDQIRTCLISEGIEDYVEDVEYSGDEHREVQEKILRNVNRRFGEQLRNLELESKIREEKRVREAPKQRELNDRKSFKEQNQDGDGADLSNHTSRADVTNNQQEGISTSRGDQVMRNITNADDKADVEVQQKQKRDVQYFDYSPRTSVKKIKSGENKLAVESEQARNQRLRDLYYSGLIPSMDDATILEKADAAKLQVEDKRGQDTQKGNPQYSESMVLKDEKSSDDKPQTKTSGRKIWIDVDYEAQDKHLKTNRRDYPQILIPDTFHNSFQKKFPKLQSESKLEFRKRKLAAYVVSDEYKQRQSADEEYLPSGINQSKLSNEVGTHAKVEKMRKPRLPRQGKNNFAREVFLRKQAARKLEEQRQQVSNAGNARNEGITGKLVEGSTGVDDQIPSNVSDNKGLADHGSEKNAYMKRAGGSRSQSRGVLGTRQELYSSNTHLPAVFQHKDAVMTGSNIETAIDLTSD
ncbi:uncharacterized protein EAE97_006953 [Botrytis byssoidea]|uniref:Uncharacterized protein n=1 Tax=Botrytis byssoidea TaxID=139641 RepID=A0A9P5IH94_9HELO|nr:uncharacterized protein EAE97_006953 [Botrytis byssoidea]KAF7940767.1 hypothetical protein EAE97_006953 [Botrytis byssoidea]